jgi:hypothetical protein
MYYSAALSCRRCSATVLHREARVTDRRTDKSSVALRRGAACDVTYYAEVKKNIEPTFCMTTAVNGIKRHIIGTEVTTSRVQRLSIVSHHCVSRCGSCIVVGVKNRRRLQGINVLLQRTRLFSCDLMVFWEIRRFQNIRLFASRCMCVSWYCSRSMMCIVLYNYSESLANSLN